MASAAYSEQLGTNRHAPVPASIGRISNWYARTLASAIRTEMVRLKPDATVEPDANSKFGGAEFPVASGLSRTPLLKALQGGTVVGFQIGPGRRYQLAAWYKHDIY